MTNHAEAHPYVISRECGDHECDDPDCEPVSVGAWLVRTRHAKGWCDLWHVTAWVHPDHGGGARCACAAWPDDYETLPEEFGDGVLRDVIETTWIAVDRNGNPLITPDPK